MKFLKEPWSWIKQHKKISIPLIFIVLILIIIFRPKAPKLVSKIAVREGDIATSITASGTINANTSVNLTFLSGGKLTYVGVKKGDKVSAGQIIAIVDERTVEDNLQTALRNYSEQRNSFDTTQQNNQNRSPDQSLNDAMKRVLQNNQYDLDKAVISVDLQNLAKQNSVLTSPINGVITQADVTVANVTATPATTYKVVDPNSLIFTIDVDEADIGKVQEGQLVKVNLDAYSNQTINLPVSSIDFASHTTSTGGTAYGVEVRLGDVNTNQYRVGMTGNAEIITDERKHVLLIPSTAVNDDGTVYLMTKQGFEKRPVKVGIQNDTADEITSGLSVGDEVAELASDVKVVNGKPQGK